MYDHDTDKLLECNRCYMKFCLSCLPELDEQDYLTLSKAQVGCHWYCKACEKDALLAVRTDKKVEERCKTFMASLSSVTNQAYLESRSQQQTITINRIY